MFSYTATCIMFRRRWNSLLFFLLLLRLSYRKSAHSWFTYDYCCGCSFIFMWNMLEWLRVGNDRSEFGVIDGNTAWLIPHHPRHYKPYADTHSVHFSHLNSSVFVCVCHFIRIKTTSIFHGMQMTEFQRQSITKPLREIFVSWHATG